MGLKHELKRVLRYTKNEIKNIITRKTPVYIPTFEGNLLKNRVALVTGGSSGIGYSIAESFLKNGCDVIITGRNKEKLEIAIEKLKKISPSVKGIILDLKKIESFEKKVEEAEQIINKKIDILVNNAGVMIGKNFPNTIEKDFDEVLTTNLKGVYFFSQIFASYMIKNKIKGNILNISSTSENRPVVNSYSLSKWGIKGLTVGMAKKLIDYDIVVNAIAPGPTYTAMLEKNTKEKNISKSQYPLDRYIMPEEIANIAVFLTSDIGKNIVGQTLYVSKGIGITTIDDINY